MVDGNWLVSITIEFKRNFLWMVMKNLIKD